MRLISFYKSGPVCESPGSRPCTSFILNPPPPASEGVGSCARPDL